MTRRGVLAGLSALLLVACSAPAAHRRPAEPVDLEPVWRAQWRSDGSQAFAEASLLGWEAKRSVVGERARQIAGVQLGLRGQLAAEVKRWQAESPDDPDLAYLETRMLQNPERQRRAFRSLARKWPHHAWIQLGNAAVGLRAGRDWRRSAALLAGAPDWEEARPFRRLLEARLAATRGRSEDALESLFPAAFEEHDRDALLTYLEIASNFGLAQQRDLGSAEVRLLQLQDGSSAAERIDVAVSRVVSETLLDPGLELDEVLARVDAVAARAGVEGGWSQHPRYSIGPFGSLARPERASGGPAAAWLDHGRVLLAGEAIFHGAELLMLQGTRSLAVEWPGQEEPLDIFLAAGAMGSNAYAASGATLFRGFYLRGDLVARRAQGLLRAAQAVDVPRDGWQLPDLEPGDSLLPEDYDLPLRLRAEVLERVGRSAEQAARLELQALALHEAGHLPEVLAWLPDGPPLSVLPRAIGSWLSTGDVMTWLELRAEARALAAAPEPHWLLAEILDLAREGDSRYHHAYRELLDGLVRLARRDGLPPLARWNELSKPQLRQLARTWCEEEGAIATLPPEGVGSLLRALEGSRVDLASVSGFQSGF